MAAAWGSAQSFGRFGYGEAAGVAPFGLSPAGFHVEGGLAKFQYEEPYTRWNPISTSNWEQVASLSAGAGPRKIRINLLTPGFYLFFESGMRLKIANGSAPFLTWGEGSVGPNVPTPETDWVLASFAERQPPVLFSFQGSKAALKVSGGPGSWYLQTTDVDPHWVKVCAPLGTEGFATSNAASLGALSNRITPNIDIWTSPPPAMKGSQVSADLTSVTATWTFDRPGVIVPAAAQMAMIGGYRARILSPVRDLGAAAGTGPLSACASNVLQVHFPVQRIGLGRPVENNAQTVRAANLTTLSQVGPICSLAFSNLICSSDPRTRQLAKELSASFISSAPDIPEPFTGQRLPYDAAGKGLDLSAAYALLLQSVITSEAKREDNGLTLSLLLRQDWDSWLLSCQDLDLQRRSSALTALACVVASDAKSRLAAGMLEAGLAAQKGIALWREHRGLGARKPYLDPLPEMFSTLFFTYPAKPACPFVSSLLSPVRAMSDLSLATWTQDDQLMLSWTTDDVGERSIRFYGLPRLNLGKNHNVAQTAAIKEGAVLGVKVKPADAGTVQLSIDQIGAQLPPFQPAPAYSEVRD